jgi:hypothetical protein
MDTQKYAVLVQEDKQLFVFEKGVYETASQVFSVAVSERLTHYDLIL